MLTQNELLLLILACQATNGTPMSFSSRVFESQLLTSSQFDKATNSLSDLDLISRVQHPPGAGNAYIATTCGRAHLAQLLNMDLPRARRVWEGQDGVEIPPDHINQTYNT